MEGWQPRTSESDVPTIKSGKLSTSELAVSDVALVASPGLVGTAKEMDEISPASRSSNVAMLHNLKSR